MESKTINAIAFILGAAIGAAISWKIIDTKYEQQYQNDLNARREVSLKREKAEQNKDKPDVIDYTKKLKENKYVDYSKTSEVEKSKVDENPVQQLDLFEESNIDHNKPYRISPESFGEFDDYEKVTLLYYKDRVVADMDDDILEDLEETIGEDSLNHFGEYEADSVFVRNEILEKDFEIILDNRKYSDVA